MSAFSRRFYANFLNQAKFKQLGNKLVDNVCYLISRQIGPRLCQERIQFGTAVETVKRIAQRAPRLIENMNRPAAT